ncbi:hypothetical protein SNEBB_001639 [Seison nebaliae]|nr:hypothetical protein SNEBB_001639 [Seison nebaliae]
MNETLRTNTEGFEKNVGKVIEGNSLMLQSPLTRMFDNLYTYSSGRCHKFDGKYRECQANYGPTRSREMCRYEYEDLKECVFLEKTHKRHLIIQEEREKQKRAFLPSPEYDTFHRRKFHAI